MTVPVDLVWESTESVRTTEAVLAMSAPAKMVTVVTTVKVRFVVKFTVNSSNGLL